MFTVMYPGGGCTLIFSYLRRLGSFSGVKNFNFKYFFGVLEIFLGAFCNTFDLH